MGQNSGEHSGVSPLQPALELSSNLVVPGAFSPFMVATVYDIFLF